ncbi:Pyroglutamyl peptidase [Musa troglodytarum]|uniref:Pyroglutamyl peptidase n=1 Tax=Musa troglodytarum TaxID=320322 RepID=A0A9E7EPG0_9LILI|nr:Pyroglutamyl peptidase [Musa troglodytarum]
MILFLWNLVAVYAKFHGVSENPTEIIVRNLKGFMQKKGLPEGLVLGSCNVLEAAGEGALPRLYETLQLAVAGQRNETSNRGQIIWLHLGVNSGATRFAIENQAVNEATFRCPDEMGWKPQRVPIVYSDGSIARVREEQGRGGAKGLHEELWKDEGGDKGRKRAVTGERGREGAGGIYQAGQQGQIQQRSSDKEKEREQRERNALATRGWAYLSDEDSIRGSCETSLPVNEIVKALSKMGYNITPSDDAGRFVCNFVYYHSLLFAEQNGMKSLFVHVPLFLTIDEETQMEFVASLLKKKRHQYRTIEVFWRQADHSLICKEGRLRVRLQ